MKIILNKYKWSEQNGVYACGYCFDNEGNMYNGRQLCSYFANITDHQDLIQRVQAANGFFAVIIQKQETIFATTDRLCRFPIFYSNQIITDNHRTFTTRIEWDALSHAFYCTSGAVLPGHTLLKSIRQLPPSGIATYQSQTWKVETYDSFLCRKSEEQAISVEELDQVMTSVFERMIQSVSGRQIIVPLTAGNDSRLILCMLKRLHYTNVLCFTIEGKGGCEWNGASCAAQRLGYPHVKIDMQNENVRQLLFHDLERFENYYRYVGGLTNFCWLAEYVAVLFLEKQGLLSEGAIFVPGHSGDMIGGSHLTKAKVNEHMSAVDLVRRMQYVGFEYGIDERVKETLSTYFTHSLQDVYTPYSVYQNWVVQHRQAYQIVHSVRAYDFCGYDVRLPLWDTCLYKIFSHLPYSLLWNSNLYTRYIQYVLEPLGLHANSSRDGISWRKIAIRKWLKKSIPDCILRFWEPAYDPVGENILSQPLAQEVNAFLGRHYAYTNSNELLLRWYEMRVAQGRG